MRTKLLGALVGFAFGVNVAFNTFNMLVSRNPQVANAEKAGYLLICLSVVFVLAFVGFQHGKDAHNLDGSHYSCGKMCILDS